MTKANGPQSTLKGVAQAVAVFYVGNMMVTKFLAKPQAPVVPSFDDVASSGIVSDYNPIPQSIAPIWPTNSSLDIRVYVSPSLAMPALNHVQASSLVVEENDFQMGNFSDSRVIETTFPVPHEVQKNATLWAHMYVALHGHSLDPRASDYNVKNAYHAFRPLNQILAKKKVVRTKKLIGGGEDEADDVAPIGASATFASYYHPNFTLSFVPDSGVMSYPQIQPAARQWLTLETTGARDDSGQNGWYYPITYLNTFWQLRTHMIELNDTVKTLPLRIEVNNLANWKFNIYASVDENVKANQRNAANGGPVAGGGDGNEFEKMKEILLDTNIYLLATTAIVSLFHMLFEMLAFKNDVVSVFPNNIHVILTSPGSLAHEKGQRRRKRSNHPR